MEATSGNVSWWVLLLEYGMWALWVLVGIAVVAWLRSEWRMARRKRERPPDPPEPPAPPPHTLPG